MVVDKYLRREQDHQLIRQIPYNINNNDQKYVDFDDDSTIDDEKLSRIENFLEDRLIGNFDSGDFSEAWKKKFSHAPTWCDADMSLQQIRRGFATGDRRGLYARAFFQLWLYRIGTFVQRHAWITVFVTLFIYTACCAGLRDVIIETDIVKLWVSQGGRLNEELGFLGRVQHEASRHIRKRDVPPPMNPVNASHTHTHKHKSQQQQRRAPELPKENGLGGGFQVVIQTPFYEGENVLSKESLLKHVQLMQEIADYTVELHGEKWRLADICFKPPGPSFNTGPLAKVMSGLLDKIIPCIWITPIDCFWEGAKPLGPNPPLNLGPGVTSFIGSLPAGNVTWKNLNPTAVIKDVGNIIDLGPIGNFFERAGIDAAYLDRPCIDPLDVDCPKESPNYFDRCSALKKFNTWNDAREDKVVFKAVELEEEPEGDLADGLISDLFGKKRKKREESSTTPKSTKEKDEDYYAYEDDADYDTEGLVNGTLTKSPKPPKDTTCLQYGPPLLEWMEANKDKWDEFLTKEEQPQYPNYGEIMTGGCRGFGKNIMEWPEDLIIGGIERENEHMKSAEALQSVFLVASPFDVYIRYKEDKSDIHPDLDHSRWSVGAAQDVIVAWQRNFTKKIYRHKDNYLTENNRVFHPLASTSIADMLEEFSQFNYSIIFMGYGLMIVYAAFTQARIEGRWLAIQSNVLLSFVGVFLVTYSSICGLGVTTFLGINFNAATTQIVPFLTLGLGIDDMFLLLHNYDEIINICNRNEMGILLKETGMSVMVTSINNILAFFAGLVLPIPALRSFCSQTAILLAFNLASLMFIFPAFIALDLKRQRRGKRDLAYCCSGAENEKGPLPVSPSTKKKSKMDNHEYMEPAEIKEFTRNQPWYTVGGFLTNYYIPALKKPVCKAIVIMGTLSAVVFGLYGMYNSTLGLELSDVLPENTPPAAFLRAREKYFSFYPMFAVLRGQTIDIPKQQALIEEYRAALGKSDYMIKADGKLQPYWMSLLRTWLTSLDVAIEKEIKAGRMDPVTGKKNGTIAPEAAIARKLICSYGNTFNCSGRIGTVKLVKDGIINPEGFYNYLTAWYNVDNMMYYVSQASFFPVPPGWAMNEKDEVVPQADPLLYSQIPYYQTGLTDTPPIVAMIKEIRAICEEYTEKGLPNFPNGLAFTFWEQYLHLRWNLFCAICIIAFAVFAVISIMMFNPRAAAMVMVIVIVVTIELGGFMGLVGIKMNPISAVTLICAVGIGVEFTAHVVLAFLTALGSVDDRLESCLQHMFVPVFHGAISTLLGIVMLVFSEFDFVVKYFFVVMTVLVILGIFNGLCLLPVLLTVVGPTPELIPTDGSNSLVVPPSLRLQKQTKGAGMMETGLRNRKSGEVEMSNKSTTGTEEAPAEGHGFHESLSTIDEEDSKKS